MMVASYKDLLAQYVYDNDKAKRAKAGPEAEEWLRAQKEITRQGDVLQAGHRDLENLGVRWLDECTIGADQLDALWTQGDRGFRAFDVCRFAVSIETFVESVKHYSFDGDERKVEDAMRAVQSTERSLFLVNHARLQQENLSKLSWRILDARARMLDATRTLEKMKRLVESGKRRKEEQQAQLMSQFGQQRSAVAFNRSTPPRQSLNMFTSPPATSNTQFSTNRTNATLNLDRQLSEDFKKRFRVFGTADAAAAETEEELLARLAVTEEELLNYNEGENDR